MTPERDPKSTFAILSNCLEEKAQLSHLWREFCLDQFPVDKMKESHIPAEPECFVRSAVSHHPPRSLPEYFGLSIRQMIEVGISSRAPYRSIVSGGESKKTC